MYTGLQHLHSGLAYLALAALVIVMIYALIGSLGGREFTEKDRKIAMIGFILAHIQLLIGLILYFVSPLGFSLLTSGNAMADKVARLTALEHPVINHEAKLFALDFTLKVMTRSSDFSCCSEKLDVHSFPMACLA